MLSLHLAILVMNKVLTAKEADLIMNKLGQTIIPRGWRNVLKEFERVIERKIPII